MSSTLVQTENTLEAYVQTGFHEISGWLHMPALEATLAVADIQRSFAAPGPVCEIGVWEGRYLALLSFLAATPQRVLGIDPFIHSDNREAQLARVRTNINRYARRPDLVTLLEEDSRRLDPAAIRRAAGGACQFVSVDGDHTMEGCLHDLRLAQAIAAPEGIVSVDDISNLTCPGVVEGTVRYSMEPGATLAPFLLVSNKLFMAQRPYVERYRQAVLQRCEIGAAGTWGRQVLDYHLHMRSLGVPVRFLGYELLIQP